MQALGHFTDEEDARMLSKFYEFDRKMIHNKSMF